ncbi:MAG: energy transducer TonB [Cyclobacteriaceae bacterium]|nr:energy transducer TonB [Cyclobacteriaceae bacterium]
MTRTIFTILFTTTLTVSQGQILEKFEFSDCMTECIGDSTTIDMVTQTNDVTEIYLTAYANCIGNLKGQIKIINDTLNLIYSTEVTRIKNKKTGEIEEFIEVAMCDCIFKFNYTIRGLQTLDKKKVKINGENLDKINARQIREETTENTFKVDTTWSSDEIFTIVENPALFPGGFGKFKEYVDSNLIYPRNSEKKVISGKVFVEFVINKDGSIDDFSIKVVRGLNEYCDREAVRLMKECPDWTPGTIKGQQVKQKYVVGITFDSSKTSKK